MDAQNGNVATEMDTFLPPDKNVPTSGSKYRIAPKDPEDPLAAKAFDPFKARRLDNPTTDCDTLTHLLKASLGTGILAMPQAFANSGLAMGIVHTILVAFICTHCAYVLVKCAHELYRRRRVTAMSFAEVAEVSFANGPAWGRPFSKFAKQSVLFGLFITYFGTCSVYSVIIAKNFEVVINHYTGSEMDIRVLIACLLVPLVLLSWIPDLKYLAPVSMVANLFMGVGLGITFYYLVTDVPPLSDREMVAPITAWPAFFSICIFAMEAIGVVMPLENQMKTPQNFIGITGVLNQGMAGVTLVYIFLGFMGYLKFGPEVQGSVTLDLHPADYLAQAVQILIGLAVFCTFGLQFYVCLDIGWNGVKDNFKKHPKIGNYLVRTILVVACVLLAIAVPTIGPFIGLIGAFCFSILGLLVPVLIETVTYWDQGFGKYNWRVWKNVVVSVFGILAVIFGSKTSIEEIVAMYQ